jgi:hypothetical protein
MELAPHLTVPPNDSFHAMVDDILIQVKKLTGISPRERWLAFELNFINVFGNPYRIRFFEETAHRPHCIIVGINLLTLLKDPVLVEQGSQVWMPLWDFLRSDKMKLDGDQELPLMEVPPPECPDFPTYPDDHPMAKHQLDPMCFVLVN